MCGALKLSGIVRANFRLNIAIAMLFLSLNLGCIRRIEQFLILQATQAPGISKCTVVQTFSRVNMRRQIFRVARLQIEVGTKYFF